MEIDATKLGIVMLLLSFSLALYTSFLFDNLFKKVGIFLVTFISTALIFPLGFYSVYWATKKSKEDEQLK